MSDKHHLKIGYAKDPQKRLKSLTTGNPDIEILKVKPGNTTDETIIQEKCKQWHYNREWYEDTLEVREIFNKHNPFTEERLEKLKKQILLSAESVCSTRWFGSANSPIFTEIKELSNDRSLYSEEFKEYLKYCDDIQAFCTLRNAIYTRDIIPEIYFTRKYQISPEKIVRFSVENLDPIIQESNELLEEAEDLDARVKGIKEDMKKCQSEDSLVLLREYVALKEGYIQNRLREVQKNTKFIDYCHKILS